MASCAGELPSAVAPVTALRRMIEAQIVPSAACTVMIPEPRSLVATVGPAPAPIAAPPASAFGASSVEARRRRTTARRAPSAKLCEKTTQAKLESPCIAIAGRSAEPPTWPSRLSAAALITTLEKAPRTKRRTPIRVVAPSTSPKATTPVPSAEVETFGASSGVEPALLAGLMLAAPV